MAKTIYLLTKNGDKTYFNRAGVAFDENRDGSVNFKLDLFPAATFQIRDNQEAAHDAGMERENGRDNARRR